MYCEKCGMSVPDGSAYCPNCGAKLVSEQPAPASGHSASPEAEGHLIIAVVGLVLAFLFAPAGLVLGIITLNQHDPNTRPLGKIAIIFAAIVIAIFSILFIAFIVMAISGVNFNQWAWVYNSSGLFD